MILLGLSVFLFESLDRRVGIDEFLVFSRLPLDALGDMPGLVLPRADAGQ